MADSQKKNSSVNAKEKDPLQDLEIGNDLFSWKSISMGEGDDLDFDLTPVSKGNKKTFTFDKTDMDFNLDTDFGKIASFNLDMSDLDISPSLKRDAKSKEKSKESSNAKDKGKTDQFAFGFDFDELENFNFDSITKTQREKNNKGSSPNESASQDKEASSHINENGSKSTLKDGPQKPTLTESRITLDMDCLVGVADLEPSKEIYPSNSATDDGVTPEHSAAIDAGGSDKAKGPLETTLSRELPNTGLSKSGGDSSAAEKNENSMDENGCSNVEQDVSMTLAVGSTCNYKHTASGNSQQLQAVAVSENIIEPSGGNSLTAENNVSCMDTDVSGSNGEQDATMKLAPGSTRIYEHTSKNSEDVQAVAISENISGRRSQDETEDHTEDDRRTERGQTNSCIENICTTGAVSEIPSDKDSQEPALEILRCPSIRGSQPADPSEKQTDNIKEPLINCSRPLIQLEKPECPVLKAPTQTMLSSLSSKQTGFAQPILAEGRAGDATQRDRKLFSLSLQCSKTLLRGNIPQIQSQDNSLKIYGEAPIADSSLDGNKLNDSGTAQDKDKVKAECGPRQRELCMKDLDTLSMDTNRKQEEKSGNPKKLASVSVNKSTPAKEHRAWSIEGSRKPPGLPGLKLSRLSIDSTKSPIWKESKSIETSNQKTVSFRKSPPGMAHLPEKSKQTTSILSMKRTLEDAAADTIAVHPSKRLSQSAAASRSFQQTSEKVLDKKAPSHNDIKSTAGNCQVTPFDIPNQVKTKEVEIVSSTRNDSNIELADAYSKQLDDLCDTLRKKHDEAKDLLVGAIVNSNKLLMLNNPTLEEKIRATQSLFGGLTINSIHG